MLSFVRNVFSIKNSQEVMAAAARLVQQELQAHKVVVFSKSYCPFCKKAKEALNAEVGRGKYRVIEIENRQDCSAIQDYLAQITGGRTVPRVFIDGKFIGGGTETAEMQRNGQLRKLLSQDSRLAA